MRHIQTGTTICVKDESTPGQGWNNVPGEGLSVLKQESHMKSEPVGHPNDMCFLDFLWAQKKSIFDLVGRVFKNSPKRHHI